MKNQSINYFSLNRAKWLLRFYALIIMLAGNHAFAQKRPTDFTPEERLLVKEATNRFPRKSLPDVRLAGYPPIWMDSERVLYTVSEIVGRWRAEPDEYNKVVIIHVDTGEIEETLYRGNLACYANGKIVIAIPRDPSIKGIAIDLDRMFEGRFGEELKAVEIPLKGKNLIQFSCDFVDISKRLAPDDIVADIPLLPTHGFLRLPLRRPRTSPESTSVFELFDKDRNLFRQYPVRLGGYPLAQNLQYIPWMNRYFGQGTTGGPSQIISPTGEYAVVTSPEPIAGWSVASNVGGGRPHLTKKGTAWSFIPWYGYWRMQGIYLESSDGLLRVDDAGVASLAVSPDGCKLFYFRRPGDQRRRWHSFLPTVMDLCSGEKDD